MTWYTIKHEALAGCPSYLPTDGGCYAIYADGQLVYIGSSGNLQYRIKHHMTNTFRMGRRDGGLRMNDPITGKAVRVPVERWVLKVRPARFFGEWATLELRLLRRLKPRCNIASVGPKSSRFVIDTDTILKVN